jgi:hypothetical protein
MQIAIISTALAIVFFLCMYLGFRTGIRLGMQVAKGIVPPKVDPVGTVARVVTETKLPQSELLKGYANMMNFTGEPDKEK